MMMNFKYFLIFCFPRLEKIDFRQEGAISIQNLGSTYLHLSIFNDEIDEFSIWTLGKQPHSEGDERSEPRFDFHLA